MAAMSERRPIGDAIDNIGVRATMSDGELLDGAVVIMRILDRDGRTRVSTAWSDGMDWIVRRGLLEVSLDVERVPPESGEMEGR
jgi:hypothetical protein